MADVVERGDLYFFYRPRVHGETDAVGEPRGRRDVQRLFMIMSPQNSSIFRLIVLGRKRMPSPREHERLWGFVDRVERDAASLYDALQPHRYRTKTRGVRELPAARAAGEGVYGIVRHDGHTHLAYVLELPDKIGDVQKEFNIESESSYIMSVKNPSAPSPRGTGLSVQEKAAVPKRKVQEKFGEKRFAEPDPELLDHAGTEFVLIGADEDAQEELGVDLQAEQETAASAEIFRDLKLQRAGIPTKPLFTGDWQ